MTTSYFQPYGTRIENPQGFYDAASNDQKAGLDSLSTVLGWTLEKLAEFGEESLNTYTLPHEKLNREQLAERFVFFEGLLGLEELEEAHEITISQEMAKIVLSLAK